MLALFLLGLATGALGVAENRVKIEIEAKQFANPSGQNWNGKCCDSWSSKKKVCTYSYEYCDYSYRFCVEAFESGTQDADQCSTGWLEVDGANNMGTEDFSISHMAWGKESWLGCIVKYQVFDRDFRNKKELVDKGYQMVTNKMYPGQSSPLRSAKDEAAGRLPNWGEKLMLNVEGTRAKQGKDADTTKFKFGIKVSCADRYGGEGCSVVAMPSCAEWKIYNPKEQRNGIYTLRDPNSQTYEGMCEMIDGGGKPTGWTVVQTRGYDMTTNAFDRKFSEYENGFGDTRSDFWLGLRRMHYMAQYYKNDKKSSPMTMRIEATDCEGNTEYIEYDDFELGDGPNYALRVAPPDAPNTPTKNRKIRGNLGDAINTFKPDKNPANINGASFYASDNGNTGDNQINCAEVYKAGWWYNVCSEGNPNGNIVKDCRLTKKEQVLNTAFWAPYRGFFYTMKKIRIMIRPKDFMTRFAEGRKERDGEIWIP